MGTKELNVMGWFRYEEGEFRTPLRWIEQVQLRVKELVTATVGFHQVTETWEMTRRGDGIKTLMRKEGFDSNQD